MMTGIYQEQENQINFIVHPYTHVCAVKMCFNLHINVPERLS